jgi:copper/silver efflux system protein
MAVWRDFDNLTAEMDRALQFPGVSNAWTMPIKARIDMLSTGIRTPVGVKVIGRDLTVMEGQHLEPLAQLVDPDQQRGDQRILVGARRRGEHGAPSP